tara:strand:+ start:1883 stop:2161 length:279 start_codon:yes stop_codon:yes gene_type:complete
MLFVSSCGAAKKAFTNEKKNSSDEFLVQKKSPLVMPPDFNDLPNPETENTQVEEIDADLQSLITNKKENSDNKNDNKNKDFEVTILEKIQNN